MGKLQKNELGFSVVEIVLVVVVIALIGTVGWLIYKNHHKTTTAAVTTTSSTKPTTSTKTTTTTATTNPYSGWKTGTLQYEQISYMYPSNWTLSGSSMSPSQQNVQNDDGLIFYPGEDDYTLKSPSGNQVQLIAGLGSGFIPYQIFSGSGLTLQLLGGGYYINFGTYNSGELPSGSLPSEACVGSTSSSSGNANSYILSKYITYKDPTDSPPTSGSGSDGFCYIPKNSESVTAFESDSDFTTAKLIFESMKY